MSTTRQTFRVEGMHCASCALLIDDTVADLPGVRSTQTSMKSGRSTVELDGSVSPADVVAAITELGYLAHHLP